MTLFFFWFAVSSTRGPHLLQCKERTLPSVTVIEGCMTVEHSAVVPMCKFESRALTRRVNALVELKLRDASDYEEAAPTGGEDDDCGNALDDRTYQVSADCDRPFRIADVVSYPCRRVWTVPRPGGTPWPIILQLGSSVRELSLPELLVNDAAEPKFWELVRDDIRRQMKEQDEDAGTDDRADVEERLAEANTRYAGAVLTPDGLRVSYDHYVFGWSIIDATIPYAKLHGILQPRLIPTKP